MNDQLQKALEQFLLKMIDGFEKAGEFTVEQVPDVIQQALTWFALKSGIGFAIGLLMLAACLIAIRWGLSDFWAKDENGNYKKNYAGELDVNFERCISLMAGLVGLIITFVVLFHNLEWLQILVAPKWFIVSEMSKLL